MAGGLVDGVAWLERVEDEDDGDELWDDAAANEGSDSGEELPGEEVPAAQDLLAEGAFGDELAEAVYRWQEHEHPRWPKGTPRGGEFIEVGQQFNMKGILYEIDHLVRTPDGGRVIAHVANAKYADSATRSFDVKAVNGERTVPEMEGPERKAITAGSKGLGLDLPTVDPYVDPATHDPSIPLPANSQLTPEQWKRFGKIDQELYVHLQENFGKYQPGKSKGYMEAAFADAKSGVAEQVRATWGSQYGSAQGTRFNFGHLVSKITDKLSFEKAHRKREEMKRTMAEVQAVMQWDLYNRLREPDVTVFHRSHDTQNWWKSHFVSGQNAVKSGMSQSWKFSASHNQMFGDTVVATPLAIRHVCMSNPFVVPVYSSNYTKKELEMATADGLAIDSKSFVFSENALAKHSPQAHKWLTGQTLDDAIGGSAIFTVRDAMESGKYPPLPPPPAVITMDKTGEKLWLDPPNDVGVSIKLNANGEDLPKPLNAYELGYDTPTGEPDPQPANQLGISAGDFIEGMKGTRYVIIDDPANVSFPYKYAEIDKNGNWAGPGKTFSFDANGTHSHKKLNGHVDLPKPVVEEGKGPFWDPAAWAHGATKTELKDAKAGDKFKVNDVPFEIVGIPGAYGQVPIKNLENGETGKINSDYQAALMVPVEDYVPVESVKEVLSPDPGVTFSYNGEKYVVTKQLKSGQIQAKRAKGAGVIKLSEDDEALQPDHLHNPASWTIGSAEVKAGDLQPGQKFHGGTGVLHQKPYLVTANDGKKIEWRNLDTGQTGEMKASKKVKPLVPAQAEQYVQQPGAPTQPGVHIPENWLVGDEDQYMNDLKVGDKFVFTSTTFAAPTAQGTVENIQYEVVDIEGGDTKVKVLTGDKAGNVIPLPTEQWSTEQFALRKLTPKTPQVIGGPVSGFNSGGYVDGDVTKIDDMPEGTVFVGAKDTPYLLVKKGPKSGAVATNLLTGKPYPAIKYEKEFKVLQPKSTVDLDRDQLVVGDQVKIGKLEVGDQFKMDGEIQQVTALSNSSQLGPEFAKVTPEGLYPIASSFGTFPDMPVEFYAKAGEGYDPTVKPPELDPVHPAEPGALPNAVTDGGYAAYKSSAGPGGAYKHDRIKDMGLGVVFQDKSGKLWKVTQAGANPIISDGEKHYAVDGMLRGRAANLNLSDAMLKSFSDQVDQVAAPTPSAHPDTAKFVANGTGMDLSVLQPGEHFKKDGEIWKVQGHGHVVTSAEKADGTTKMFATSTVPDEVEMQKPPTAPSAPEHPMTMIGEHPATHQHISALPKGALFEHETQYGPKTYVSDGQGVNGMWHAHWVDGDIGDTIALQGHEVVKLVEMPGAVAPPTEGAVAGKTYKVGPYTSTHLSNLNELQVGDLYVANPELHNDRVWRVTGVGWDGDDRKLEIEQVYGPEVGQESVVTVKTPYPVAIFGSPQEPYVPEFSPDNYEVQLSTHKLESVKPGVVFYFDQQPYVKMGGEDHQAPKRDVMNLETGQITQLGADEKVVPLIPKAGPKLGPDTMHGLADGPKVLGSDLKLGMIVRAFPDKPPMKVVQGQYGKLRIEFMSGPQKGAGTSIVEDKTFTQLVPVGSSNASGLLDGLPVFQGGEKVEYQGQQWSVIEVSASGSILTLQNDQDALKFTKIGKGNVTLLDQPGAPVTGKPGVGQKVLPSQLQPGMEFKTPSDVVFHVDNVTPKDDGKVFLEFTVVASGENILDVGEQTNYEVSDDIIHTWNLEWTLTKMPGEGETPPGPPPNWPEAVEEPSSPEFEYSTPEDFDKGIAPEGSQVIAAEALSPGDQFNFPHGQKTLTVTSNEFGVLKYKVTNPGTGVSTELSETDLTQDVWLHPAPLVQPGGISAEEKAAQQLLEKYGSWDAIPVDTDTVGYKAEWGSGGAFRYRELWWVPTGDQFYSKSGGMWQKLATVPGGILAVNVYTGEGRVFPNSSLRVKPPKGVTWK